MPSDRLRISDAAGGFLFPSPASVAPAPDEQELHFLRALDADLERRFAPVMVVDHSLTRKLVSFQANKERPCYRWFKFKEAFSAALVEHLLAQNKIHEGKMLDPFAGTGTALFAAADAGVSARGIEVLPVGCAIIKARRILRVASGKLFGQLEKWRENRSWLGATIKPLNTLRITRLAYPPETEKHISKYLAAIDSESWELRAVLQFALLCVLEEVGYTRKDGQFLRWDNRSGRDLRQIFHKGEIPRFADAIDRKIGEIIADERAARSSAGLFSDSKKAVAADVSFQEGSCLDILPSFPSGGFQTIVTSPPYCNRYDYTRTYALELAALGIDEERLSGLRQRMLSCTVENRVKDLIARKPEWKEPIEMATNHSLLAAIVDYLRRLAAAGGLNNKGIVRMVAGYFEEMACVVFECFRALDRGGHLFMVNDNVRFGGCDISVDLILSDFAERVGFRVERISILPQKKGNSSQQMGAFGRSELRKCVYHWRKP